jgi:hypothetical protein
MKKYLVVLLCLMLICSVVNAQYAVNKTKYDYRTYEYEAEDPYRPVVAGLSSFLFPGLGQMISGEFDRGLNFLGGYVGCLGIYFGYTLIKSSMEGMFLFSTGSSGVYVLLGEAVDSKPELEPLILLVLGLAVVDIWAVVDAIRVAKVNNLAWRDKHKTGVKIDIQPNVNYFQTNDKINARMGLRIKLHF